MPGRNRPHGHGDGKTGTPSARTAGTPFPVTPMRWDAYWNVVSNVTNFAGITSSDGNATCRPTRPLQRRDASVQPDLITAGNQTVTATDLTDARNLQTQVP